MRIYKYDFFEDAYFELELPKGARILKVDVQRGRPRLWALVDIIAPVEKREFRIIGTGWEIDVDNLHYIDSFQMAGGDLIWHLFEVE